MRIVNDGGPGSIDAKRFYLAATITDTCPECGEEVTLSLDGEDGYLSYPAVNRPFDFAMFHLTDEEDHHEWRVQIILRVHLEPAP